MPLQNPAVVVACMVITSFIGPLLLYLNSSSLNTNIKSSSEDNIRSDGIELINRGITFMYPHIIIKGRYDEAVNEFYNKMINDPRAFGNITNQLSREFKDTNQLIQKGKDKFNIDKDMEINSTILQKLLIYLYTTNSSKSIYFEMNKVLRNHTRNGNNKTISAEEMHIAPYAAALTATIRHWNHLETTAQPTYRGININITHVDSVIWISFTSSSLDLYQAQKYGNVTMYIIKNTGKSTLQPKLIYRFSDKPNEKEALYPPGSFFKIIFTNKTEIGTSYHITLSDNAFNTKYANPQHGEFR